MTEISRQADIKNLPPPIISILSARGYKTSKQINTFLYPDYKTGLHNPFLLKDMELAIKRIFDAINKNEKITIYGDYDIDGLTATVLLLEVVKRLGGQVDYYIPDRLQEGYGLNIQALKILKRRGTKLIITVDCGITAIDEIDWAIQNGLDVIVTDHHTVNKKTPAAAAIINPRQRQDRYPFKDLAGVGVAFKLVQGLQRKSDRLPLGQEKWLLDLVALGTICDAVNLIDENRILTKYGLIVLRQSKRPGLLALAEVSAINLKNITSYHLGFVFGPRLNAAGRLKHASSSLELLIAQDIKIANKIASRLNRLNNQRQINQSKIVLEATKQAENFKADPILVLASENWPHGLVGIAASIIAENFAKPTLVIQILDQKVAKGSARSFGNFDVIKALKNQAHNFIELGGHKFAAGFTLQSRTINKVRQELINYYSLHKDQKISKKTENLTKISLFKDINQTFLEALTLMEPFGVSNEQPKFQSKTVRVLNSSIVGKKDNHLRLKLADTAGNNLDAIAFGQADADTIIQAKQMININYYISENEYNGRKQPQLIITDIQ